MLNELEHSFSSDQQCVVHTCRLSSIPAVMENRNWKKQVMELASFYINDFPSEGNLDIEIVCWETK